MKSINVDMLDLGRSQYKTISGLADAERDKDGFIILKPTAVHADRQLTKMTTNIDVLESKLKEYKAKKSSVEDYKETDDYKESKKELSKKKKKKQKESLLQMVFNNADAAGAEADEEEAEADEDGSYKESKRGTRKKGTTTLETTYGKRFSPIVSMLHDTITEFDQIAADINRDLMESKNSSRTMYRSSQIGNMISAKNSKLSAVKELAAVATKLSDLEYKQQKEKKDAEGASPDRAIAGMAAKYLRGGLDDYDVKRDKKKGKDKDKKPGKKFYRDDDDTDEDESETGSFVKSADVDKADQHELAAEFAKSLLKRKDDIKLTAWEKNLSVEGKYSVMIAVDPQNLDDYRVIAVDNKTGKEIPDFKDDHKDLLPKKRKMRLVFDLAKNRATDKNTAKTYKLVYTH